MKTANDNPLRFIPLFLLLHNIEEAITMPHWLSVHLPMLRERISLFSYLQFSSQQLYVSLFMVTIVPVTGALLCFHGEMTKPKLYFLFILQSIIFWNALMPHVSGVFLLGMYNPGVYTAVLLNIPYSIYLAQWSSIKMLISRKERAGIILASLILYLPVVYLNHFLASFIAKQF